MARWRGRLLFFSLWAKVDHRKFSDEATLRAICFVLKPLRKPSLPRHPASYKYSNFERRVNQRRHRRRRRFKEISPAVNCKNVASAGEEGRGGRPLNDTHLSSSAFIPDTSRAIDTEIHFPPSKDDTAPKSTTTADEVKNDTWRGYICLRETRLRRA